MIQERQFHKYFRCQESQSLPGLPLYIVLVPLASLEDVFQSLVLFASGKPSMGIYDQHEFGRGTDAVDCEMGSVDCER